LGIPTLRMLFPLLYQPLGYEVNGGDYLVFGVFSLFFVLSFYFPSDRPLWQRRAYIWFEIICLLATRLFSHWGLDLLLWLVIVKSCFLLQQKEAIFTAIASGIAWQIVFARYFLTQILQPAQMEAQLEALASVPVPLQVLDIVLNSTSIFIAANFLIILLCMTAIAERKSRLREAALAQEVEILAADLERTRIARDIHDSLGHTLTALDVQLELAKALYERQSEGLQQALETTKTLASQALQEVRRSVATLREECFDLNEALTHLIHTFQQNHNLTIHSKIDLPELPLQTSHQLYCIIKEGLENIRRHSQANAIQLQGEMKLEEVIITLKDDGIGFDLSQPISGFGLQGMQERSHLIGGEFALESSPGQGTTIQIKIKL
ncbi:MAG: sensor histidine kinase, partial [Spirulinaceae cyanobacterium]